MKIFSKSIVYLVLLVLPFYSFVCDSSKGTLNVNMLNPNSFAMDSVYLEFGIDEFLENLIIKDGRELIPYHVLKSENGKRNIGVLVSLLSGKDKLLKIEYGADIKKPVFKNRTYAELSMKPDSTYFDGRFRGNRFVSVTKIKVPTIHTDHDALFKYEGPGWESEKVGYRFYLDWRNAIDIFGKKKDQLILANVGVHDTVAKDDSYHSMQDWGMDIFKVGKSLGIGSFGMWHGGKVVMVSTTDSVYCEITENGPLKSEIMTNYYGWKVGDKKYNLESKLSITALSRLTKNEIEISNDPSNIVTGLAKYEGTEFFESDLPGEWEYIALYGNQTLVSDDDKLGLAVFFRNSDLIEKIEDNLSYIVKLKPSNGKTHYYFCAAWEQEENGIKNLEQFKKYLFETQQLLNNPIIVTNGQSDK